MRVETLRPGAGLADLAAFVTTDYLGITRGRSIDTREWESGGATNCGWCPANTTITPFDLIADGSPFGSEGDLRLIPDRKARYRTTPHGAYTPLDMIMSDVVELDGRPWSCCPRSFLKTALADLEREAGLMVTGAFEVEFSALETSWHHAPAFSLAAMRRTDPFGPAVMAALSAAGVEPEVFIPEYGRNQFEITHVPAPALIAADRAVALREIIREVARLMGFRASFSPKTAVAGVGNGVHIHYSLRDRHGHPMTFDASQPGRISKIAGAFTAGVIRHLPALCALTAPSPISYLRLKPHNWSSSYTWLGERDRESTIRICSTYDAGGKDPSRQFNLEYRAADGCASPHLAMGAIVRAGLEGIRENLPTPAIYSGDPTLLSENELERHGLRRLPTSLEAALQAFEADKTVSGWFDATFHQAYLATKRMEIKLVEGLDPDLQCQRYAEVY
ncbi:MAG: glutamine synthetase family protein [Hyphomicrobiaceae bacterium]